MKVDAKYSMRLSLFVHWWTYMYVLKFENIKSCARKWFAVQRPYIHVFFRPPARKRSLVFGFAVWQMMSGSRGIKEIYLTLRRSDTVISAWACRGIDECIVGAYDDAYTLCPCRMLYCWCVTCTVRVFGVLYCEWRTLLCEVLLFAFVCDC